MKEGMNRFAMLEDM